jgi:hypothetical protein
MTQPDLFSARPVVLASPTLERRERRRLSKQNAEILARLQRGSASNSELAEMALNYRARISELRQAGFNVECFDRNRETGYARYRIA